MGTTIILDHDVHVSFHDFVIENGKFRWKAGQVVFWAPSGHKWHHCLSYQSENGIDVSDWFKFWETGECALCIQKKKKSNEYWGSHFLCFYQSWMVTWSETLLLYHNWTPPTRIMSCYLKRIGKRFDRFMEVAKIVLSGSRWCRPNGKALLHRTVEAEFVNNNCLYFPIFPYKWKVGIFQVLTTNFSIWEGTNGSWSCM